MKTNDRFEGLHEEYSEFRQSDAVSNKGHENIEEVGVYRRSLTNNINPKDKSNLEATGNDGDRTESNFDEELYTAELRNVEAERISHTEAAPSSMIHQSTPSMIAHRLKVMHGKKHADKHRVYVRDDSIELRSPTIDR